MGLLNAIGQGISQAGYAAGDIFAKQAAAEQNSVMELERQKRLAEFQAELKNAPLKRYGAILKDEAGKEVTEPGKTTVIDAPSEFMGGENAGIENAKGLINAPPTTRKRTEEEARSAANTRAMQEDPEAYAEFESRIGKPLREERKLDAIEAKNEADAKARAESEARKERIAAQKDATARYIADLNEEGRESRAADRERRLARLVTGNMGTKEAMSFIDNARKELANDAATLKSMYAADIREVSPKQRDKIKADYEPKFAAIEEKRRTLEADFDSLRKKVGLPEREQRPPTPKPTPAPKPGAAPANRPPLSSFMK